jgi:hypothetical protein
VVLYSRSGVLSRQACIFTEAHYRAACPVSRPRLPRFCKCGGRHLKDIQVALRMRRGVDEGAEAIGGTDLVGATWLLARQLGHQGFVTARGRNMLSHHVCQPQSYRRPNRKAD